MNATLTHCEIKRIQLRVAALLRASPSSQETISPISANSKARAKNPGLLTLDV